jgi:hypothetical protein
MFLAFFILEDHSPPHRQNPSSSRRAIAGPRGLRWADAGAVSRRGRYLADYRGNARVRITDAGRAMLG